MKPTKELLENLYVEQKISPDEIGKRLGYSGRTIREYMTEYGIPRLGPSHLRKGKPATWNIGRKPSEEMRDKNRRAHTGRKPYNYGKGRIAFACEVCGVEVIDKPYRRKRTCSKKCKDQISHLSRGENHWNSKTGDTSNVQRKRKWSQYREWRSGVLKRADYTCACCGVRGGRLTSHHLYTWNDHEEKRFDLDNGVCLCWKCHWAFHNDCSHHHTTEDMFTEWLATKRTGLLVSTN